MKTFAAPHYLAVSSPSARLFLKSTGKKKMSSELAASFNAAREITRRNATSFYVCSLALPKAQRQAAYAVYAFCRYVDDAVDRAEGPAEMYAAKEALHEDLPEFFAGRTAAGLPWVRAFSETVHQFQIPRRYFEDLIHGVCLDARESVRVQTWVELREYSYFVAGAVGLIMARIFDLQDERWEEAAVCLGVAMQLTNILRDVGEDLQRDRIYLPKAEMDMFGVSEEDLRAGKITPQYREMIAYQMDRARSYYVRAEEGIPLLRSRSGRFCVWLMRFVYAGINRKIEVLHYDNLHHRAKTNLWDKLDLAMRALKNHFAPRPLDPEFFRRGGLELSHTP